MSKISAVAEDQWLRDVDGFTLCMETTDVITKLQNIISMYVKDRTLSSRLIEKYSCTLGYDALSLTVAVEYPLSVVFSESLLTEYQILFRFLFKTLVFERYLMSFNVKGNAQCDRIFLIRYNMLFVLRNLRLHCTSNVIQPLVNNLKTVFSEAESIETVISSQKKFVDSCFLECMLTNSTFLDIFASLFSCFKCFCCILESSPSSTLIIDLDEVAKQYDSSVLRLLDALQSKSVGENGYKFGMLLTTLKLNTFYSQK